MVVDFIPALAGDPVTTGMMMGRFRAATTSPAVPYALRVAFLAAFGAELAMVLVWRTAYGPWEIARELLVTAVWGSVAFTACRLRPERLIGPLMLSFTVLLAIVGPVGLGVQDHGWVAAAVTTVGIALVPFQIPLGAHLLLAFPTGRLFQRSHRLIIGVAYFYAALESIGLLLTSPRRSVRCGGPCAENLANVLSDPDIHSLITAIAAAGWLPLAGWFAVLVVQRYRRASRRERRVLAPPFAATTAIVIVFVYLASVGAVHGENVFGAGPAPDLVGIVILQLVLLAVPLCFLLGLLRERLAYSGVSDLVRDLDSASRERRDLTSALARALGDPTLQVGFPVGDRLLDARGHPITPPQGRSVTPVGEPAHPLAVLIHESSLDDEPELLVAAGSAARLALDNARLHAEVIAQLAEVRASRDRIIAAGDEARRRLERDLHDGAQQRLLAAGLALQLLATRLADQEWAELLSEAEAELAGALQELRELAAGIHPAVLTDQGLRPALAALADRCPLPLSIVGEDTGRLPGPIESAAYFCTTEAVTNAVKHAGPAAITVAIHRTADSLTLNITDDGRGGADPTGGGFRGLADRVAALDGTLAVASPPGGGTRITVNLPCA